MKLGLALAGLAVSVLAVASSVVAAPSQAPSSVATKLQLRGHLPDLGEKPSIRVFLAAETYNSFHRGLGDADVFPASGSLFMSFDKEILVLYARGNDVGGRCLRPGGPASVSADAVTLDLVWEAGTCGAPASAHYPFVLASLSRQADDGSSWIPSGRALCAAAPGVDGSRTCASASGGVQSPAPTATPTVGPSPTPTAPPTATPTAPTASPRPTALPATTAPAVSRTSSQTASPTATLLPASGSFDKGLGVMDGWVWLAMGVILGVFLTGLVMSRSRRNS